jgi:hypothetical protein
VADQDGPTEGTQGTDLNTQLSALVRQAVGEALASFQPLQAPPPQPALLLTTTPKLGLKMPALDDPALIQDINDNSVILDDAITATVTATLYNKTLEAPVLNNPTINGWGNLDHTHLDTNSGGALDGASITTGDIGTGYLTRESHVTDQITLALTGGGVDLVSPDLIDAVVRDTLWFGPAPTGAPDASLSRTGPGALRADTHLGVGVNPAAWGATYTGLQVGIGGALWGGAAAFSNWSGNAYFDGTNRRALTAAASSEISLNAGSVSVSTAPSVAAGAAQTFTTRLTLNEAGNLGVGVTPVAWHATDWKAMQLGMGGAVWGHTGFPQVLLGANTYFDAANQARAIVNGLAARLYIAQDGSLTFANAVNASAGASHAFTSRAAINSTGTLTLTPDAGQTAIAFAGGPVGGIGGGVGAPTVNLRLFANNALELDSGANFVTPARHAAVNLGASGLAWATVYAQNGTIQPSSSAAKEGITPLDPLACYEAAKSVKWFEFAYLPPVYQEPPEQEGQAPEERQRQVDEGKAAHARMLVETAPARHQRGFVFPDTEGVTKDEAGGALPPVPDLFGLSDRESTTPQADIATLGCAMQEIIRRLEAVEASQAPTGTTRRRSRAA